MDGFLSPNGVFYDAEYTTHPVLADEIIEQNNLQSQKDMINDIHAEGERLLELLGYIKLKYEYPGWVDEWNPEWSIELPHGVDGMTNQQYMWLNLNWDMLSEDQQDMLNRKGFVLLKQEERR